jgi:hypothetical protein
MDYRTRDEHSAFVRDVGVFGESQSSLEGLR